MAKEITIEIRKLAHRILPEALLAYVNYATGLAKKSFSNKQLIVFMGSKPAQRVGHGRCAAARLFVPCTPLKGQR